MNHPNARENEMKTIKNSIKLLAVWIIFLMFLSGQFIIPLLVLMVVFMIYQSKASESEHHTTP